MSAYKQAVSSLLFFSYTVNHLIFAAIKFRDFVFRDIFSTFYFRCCKTGLCRNNVQQL